MSAKPYIVEDGDHVALYFDARAVQCVMAKSDPYRLVLHPLEAMMWGALLRPEPSTIAIVGLGGGGHAKWCLRHFPSAVVRVAEIDSDVIAIARRSFAVPEDSERFRVHHEDGAEYVARLDREVDWLIVDGAGPEGVPPELGNDGFYERCRAALRDGGVAVFNLEAGPRTEGRVASIARRFRGVCWSLTSPVNGQTLVFAQAGGDQLSPLRQARLLANARALAARCPLDLEPALALFSPGPAEGVIAAWGRPWRCRRMIFPFVLGPVAFSREQA